MTFIYNIYLYIYIYVYVCVPSKKITNMLGIAIFRPIDAIASGLG